MEQSLCRALDLLPASTAKAFFEMGSAKGAKGVGNIAHSRAQYSAVEPDLRSTQAFAHWHEFCLSLNPAVI